MLLLQVGKMTTSYPYSRAQLHGDAKDEAFNRGESALDAEHELLPIQGAELQSDTGIEACNIVKPVIRLLPVIL